MRSQAPCRRGAVTAYHYDSLDRGVQVTEPDKSVRKTVYQPLVTLEYDEADNDSASPFKDTPNVERRDGLGRVVAIERYLAPLGTGTPSTMTLRYDA